jgi:hypothetical protein
MSSPRWILLLAFLTGPAAAQVDSTPPRERPLLAIAQSAGLNLLVNRFDAWVLGEWWAQNAGAHSWSRAFRLGWEWDEDVFPTNMFAHPYHGSMYFNAGRANGLDFWESAPITFLGSWTWEFFGEAKRPSLNDFFMTSFGGIALGEMLHRVSASIRDNQATGRPRTLRELASLPFDPIGGLNRLARGQWKARFPNPPEHNAGAFVFRIHAGLRFAEGLEADSIARLGAIVVDLISGDPFLRPAGKPFEVFGARAMFSTGGGLNALRASGRLYGRELSGPQRHARHLFAINQRFDYISNPAHKIGGQSVEFGIYSRWRLGRGFGLRTQAAADVVILGAIDAPGAGFGERNYDFGPGGGGRIELVLERSGVRYLMLHTRTELVHTISGASSDHIITFGGFELTVPVARGFGLAAHATYFTRRSLFTDRPIERRRYPELRLLAVWTRSGLE